MKKFPRDRSTIAFLDLLFILLLLFVLIVNPPKQSDAAKPSADFMLYMVWDSGRNTDMDIYVHGPDGKNAWYNNKDIGYVSVDRDDLGMVRDSGPTNQEIVGFRSPPDGSYLVSIHTYREHAQTAEPGEVHLELMNRAGRSLWHAELPMPPAHNEVGVVEFVFRDGNFVASYPSDEMIRFGGGTMR